MSEPRAVLCPNCRKLISSAETKCPYCGAARPNFLRGPLSVLMQGRRSPVEVVIGLSGAMYLLSVLLDMRAVFNLEGLSTLGGLLNFGAPGTGALYLLGMTGGLAWVCGHLWTVLTATFLHGSLLHIFFNMYWMRILGQYTTDCLTPARFAVIYLLTGASGFLASNLWSGTPTIGASCSVFGLMGVLVVYGRRRGGIGADLSRQVLTWAVICFLISFAIPNVNNAGHLGGFFSGLALGYTVPVRRKTGERPVLILALVLILATLAGFGMSIVKMWSFYQTGLPVCM